MTTFAMNRMRIGGFEDDESWGGGWGEKIKDRNVWSTIVMEAKTHPSCSAEWLVGRHMVVLEVFEIYTARCV